jgi:hypothetical protein
MVTHRRGIELCRVAKDYMRTDLQTPVFPVHDAAMPRNRCFPLPPTIRPADVIVVFWPTSLPVRGIDATVTGALPA